MSGRRSKQIRKKIAVGALVACSALGAPPLFARSETPAAEAAAAPQNEKQRDEKQQDQKQREERQEVKEAIEVVAPAPLISSPKFTQPVLDTPRTMTVIASETFQAQGATTLRDVLRNTPGITFQAGEGGGGLPGDTFSMRGFSSGNDITVDGVRDVGAYSRDAFNLEQVEVVKGPASAIAGRGAAGGSINLVTKSPRAEAFTRFSGTTGTEELSRGTIDANVPLERIEGAGLRINAMFAESGVAGRDVVHNSAWGVAPSLSFGIGKPTRFTLAYQHMAQDNVPDYGLPWAAFGATPSIDQSNFYGLEGYDYEDIRSDLASAILEHGMESGWLLRNVSRWGANERDSAITSPRPPNRQLQQRTMESTQLANQTSMIGSVNTGRLRHDLSFGVEVGREGTANRNQSQTTNQPQTTIDSPDPSQDPLGPMPENLGNPSKTNLDGVALYAFDTVQFGQKWELTGGARWDRVDVDYTLRNLATGAVTALDRQDSMLSWSAGTVFKPRANASVYASFGTAFNASVDAGAVGAALSDVPNSANNVNLEPEKTENLELGAKWELGGGRAILTGALFRTTKTNARTRSATTEPFVLDGEQRVDGVELGVNGRLTNAWSVVAGFSHLESEFVKSKNPAEVGAQLAFTPENSFNLWTDYRLRAVSVGAGVQYMDSVFRNAANTAEVPSYWLANAMAAYDVTRSLTLRLNADNLMNEHYVDRIGGGHYIPGPGRSFSLSAEVDF